MRQEVKPAEDKLPHDAYALPDDVLKPLQEEAQQARPVAGRIAGRMGRRGPEPARAGVVAEEAAQCRMGAYIAGLPRLRLGSAERDLRGRRDQIEKYAVPTMRAGDKTFVAISEPSGGSDPGRAIQTRAENKGDRYVLNGTKIWISGAGKASWGLVFARTGPSKGRGGITAFIVEKKFKGFSLQADPGDPLVLALRDQLRGLRGAGGKPARRGRRGLQARRDLAGPRARSLRGGRDRHRPGGARSSPSTGPSSARPSAPRSPTSRRSSG